MDFNVSFIDRFVLFACFMAAAEIEKICNFFPTPPRLLSHLWAASLPHVVNRCYFIHHVSCYAHTKPRLLQAAQEVNDVKAQWIILKALPSKHWRKLWGGAGGRQREKLGYDRKKEREQRPKRGLVTGGGQRRAGTVTQIPPAAVLCWKHQGVSRSAMTRLAQSTSCQHCWLMCTDNFIPLPLTPSPFSLLFIWLFYFLSSCQPASHLLSVCMESALSSPSSRLQCRGAV